MSLSALLISTPAAAAFTREPGIDGRLEERQLADQPFDVHAVPDLKQPVCHRIPIPEQLVVLGHAEVEHGGQGHGRL